MFTAWQMPTRPLVTSAGDLSQINYLYLCLLLKFRKDITVRWFEPLDYFCITKKNSPTTTDTTMSVPIAIDPIIPRVDNSQRIKNTHNICRNGDPRLIPSHTKIPIIRSRCIVTEYPRIEKTGKCGIVIHGILIIPSNHKATTIAIISTISISYYILLYSPSQLYLLKLLP